MHIVTSSYTMDASGVPTHTRTLVQALHAAGHTCEIFSPVSGPLAHGLPVVTDVAHLRTPDVILARHNVCARALAARFPNVPMCYVIHGIVPELEQPPRELPIRHWFAVNEQVRDYVGIQTAPITILREVIDVDQFAPRTTLRETPHVLFVSNYKKWRNWSRLTAACRHLGWPLTAVGSPYHRSKDMAADMNAADLVVSWGRGILEAMACGRAVLSFDKCAGDGYLTPDRYWDSRTHNFSHFAPGDVRYDDFSIDALVMELQHYHPAHGPYHRARIVAEHDVRTLVERDLLPVLTRVVSSCH